MKLKKRLETLALKNVIYAPPELPAEDYLARFQNPDVRYIFNYTSNVARIEENGVAFYFKEAKPHRSLEDTFRCAFDDFFSEIHPNDNLKRVIEDAIQSRSNLEQFLNLGEKDDLNSNFNDYLEDEDAGIFGLPALEEGDQKVFRQFLFYYYGEYINHFYNIGLREGRHETFTAVRMLSTAFLAGKLSLGDMVPRVRYVRLMLHGKERYGTLSDEANGISVSAVAPNKRVPKMTPTLLRDLNSLALLDALTGDTDHRPNNYFVRLDEQGNYEGVISYDNDAPTAFFPTSSLRKKTTLNMAPNLDKDGSLNLACLSKKVAEAFQSLSESELDPLRDYLTPICVHYLKKRLKSLQKAIKIAFKNNPHFLRDDDAWTMDDIRSDLKRSPGKTYLQSFTVDCYYDDGAHPYDRC